MNAFADMRGTVQRIFLKCPVKKQVMMFSATMSDEMRLVARKFMKNVRTSLLSQNPPQLSCVSNSWHGHAQCHRAGAIIVAS